jgi:capsid protein
MNIAAALNPRNWFSGRQVSHAPPAMPPVSNAQNRQMLRARFDNQFTTEDNRQLWALSDAMSVDASANYGVRRTLRMRCRYAYHNNPFVMGAVNRLAKFVIGSGPKLHMATKNAAANEAVERSFSRWSERVNLARKLRVSRAARSYNGEGFCLLRTNPRIKHPVKLDVFEIEADQVSSPLFGIFPSQYPDQWFDGVTLDPWGNKQTYQILRQHPGAFGAFLVMGYEFDPWPADYVMHDYARLRPAQQRGIPDIVPALDLWEEMRRTRKAVMAAHETAADHAGFIKTDAPADGAASSDTAFASGMDYVNIRRRQMGVLPDGWDAFQMKAEHPVTGYDQYMLSLLVEASQVLDMPLFILTGDARLANMSSAYVATQSFIKSVNTDRQEYGALLDQAFDEWLLEARRVPGLIPRELEEDPDHTWRWDRVATHADPQKMAMAQNQRLKNGRSPSVEFSDDGLDFDEQVARSANDYGVKPDEFRAALFQSTFTGKGTPPPAALAPGTGDEDGTGDADDGEVEDEGQEDQGDTFANSQEQDISAGGPGSGPQGGSDDPKTAELRQKLSQAKAAREASQKRLEETKAAIEKAKSDHAATIAKIAQHEKAVSILHQKIAKIQSKTAAAVKEINKNLGLPHGSKVNV